MQLVFQLRQIMLSSGQNLMFTTVRITTLHLWIVKYLKPCKNTMKMISFGKSQKEKREGRKYVSYKGWIDPLNDLTILSVQNSMTAYESSTSCLCDSGLAALADRFSPNGHYSSIYVTAGILKKIRCSGADLCCPDLHLLLWPQALNQPLHPIHNSGRRSWRKASIPIHNAELWAMRKDSASQVNLGSL